MVSRVCRLVGTHPSLADDIRAGEKDLGVARVDRDRRFALDCRTARHVVIRAYSRNRPHGGARAAPIDSTHDDYAHSYGGCQQEGEPAETPPHRGLRRIDEQHDDGPEGEERAVRYGTAARCASFSKEYRGAEHACTERPEQQTGDDRRAEKRAEQ
jgi:hypothetical protein